MIGNQHHSSKDKVIVSGSLAYDRIMTFDDQFKNHILPEKIHILNVSFTVNDLRESFGGTAGNIAFNLSLLDVPTLIIGSAGHDFARYRKWLDRTGLIDTSHISIIEDQFTATATIITDQDDNQISGFHRGAMAIPAFIPEENIRKSARLAVVSPGNIEEMNLLIAAYKKYSIPYIFDPGQTIPALSKEQLIDSIDGSEIFISNDYELQLVKEKTRLTTAEIQKKTGTLVTTLGAAGSVMSRADSQSIQIPSLPVPKVIDPTGAGDAYRAGFISGYIENQSLTNCGLMGTCAASFAIEKKGCQGHSYQPSEFKQRLSTLKNHTIL